MGVERGMKTGGLGGVCVCVCVPLGRTALKMRLGDVRVCASVRLIQFHSSPSVIFDITEV